MNQADVDRIAAAIARSDVVKILRRSIQIGQRNVRQQRVCRGTDERGIHDVTLPVELKLLLSGRIENLHRTSIFVGRGGEIAGALR